MANFKLFSEIKFSPNLNECFISLYICANIDNMTKNSALVAKMSKQKFKVFNEKNKKKNKNCLMLTCLDF